MTDLQRENWFIQEVLPCEATLRSYLGRFFSQASDIDDTVQDTYARLIVLGNDERARIRSTHSFVFATARNVALDRLRRQRIVSLETMAELDGLNVTDEAPCAWEEINTRQELALLGRALAALPERCRQVMTLRKVFGLSQREIAERMDISENTVETQVAKGMRLCAMHLYASVRGETNDAKRTGSAADSRGRKDVE